MAERVMVSLTGPLGSEPAGIAADPAALGPLGALALAVLVTERRRPVTREELAEVLWGEDLPPTWEASLRSVISRVRRRLQAAGLPDDVIAGGRGGYQLRLPADVVVDVEEAAENLRRAKEALTHCRFEPAMRLARAAVDVAARPFLPGVGGLWAEQLQARLGDLHLQALEALSEAASGAGDHPAAIAAAEACIAAQPLRESSHVQAMAAHAAAGNRAEALRAFERCRRLLAEELGVSPAPPTEAAYLALLADEATPVEPAPATNLGAELSSFVGRSEQLASVAKLLGTTRLLTLLGPGGVGKTRVAMRAAAGAVGSYRDGVWLVELAPLSDASLLASYVLAALGLAEESGSDAASSLRHHVAEREMLLLLDNCEHLAGPCAALVKDLLAAGSGLTVLATSREPLGVAGESLCPIPPLSVPDASEPDPERLWESEAVRLFLDRASSADPGFSLTHGNAPAVAELCRRLDGLPLAIELAAARARSMSVSEVASRLRDRFRLLVSRDRTAPGRHQTLQAAVDWSYEALSAGEQSLFRRLGVFAGGFTLEAAEAVCGARDCTDQVLVDLDALVDKSLVVADPSGSTTRYRLLETLRQYGVERLAAAGEEAEARSRHLAWVRALAERAEPELEAGQQVEWLQTLDREEDNIRAALDWAVFHPGGDDGLRAAGALWRYWQVRSRFAEGRRWLHSLLDATTDASPAVRAKALMSSAILALAQSDAPLTDPDTVRALFDESLALRREIGDQRGVASALHGLGGMYFRQWDPERSRACFEETLAIGRELGDKRLMAASLTNLANVAMRFRAQGESPGGLDAKTLYEEALPLWRDLGDHYATARVLSDLAAVAARHGQHALAAALLRETAEIQRGLDDRRGLAQTIKQLAGVARRQADLAGARSLLEESLALKRELQDPFLIATALVELADVWWMAGDLAKAGRLYEEAAAMARPLELGFPMHAALENMAGLALVEGRIADCRRLLAESNELALRAPDLRGDSPWMYALLAVAATAEGDRARTTEAARKVISFAGDRPPGPWEGLAMVLDVLAVFAARDGDLERAATLVGAADASRGEPPFTPYRGRPEFQEAVAAVEAALGAAAFARSRQAGASLSMEETLSLAASSMP